ncbi:hypothetical protein EAI_03647 [Harpegnathos saltator]|uniref:Uncharacterized protein n=1 Tax=Harpegnathos saltator TaxID=610380 RepID=E2B2A3_HARSA|nr:hypothetical protein EAI_03647 [Harpegnathos saltator]
MLLDSNLGLRGYYPTLQPPRPPSPVASRRLVKVLKLCMMTLREKKCAGMLLDLKPGPSQLLSKRSDLLDHRRLLLVDV